MAQVLIHRARKSYAGSLALNDVSIDIRSGEFVTLLGPSGCGKSTTLRAVAGLLALDAGRIVIGERDVTDVPIHHRDIGMVFQNLALFPHMTVAENVAFGLKMRRVPRPQRAARAQEALALVRLEEFGTRYPHQLSGGQQQRVAIARALVLDPGVLLLDEPFSALDRKLREGMQIELREITRRLGITALFVTHDQEEALTLSDRVAVMNAGVIEQIGVPDEVYLRPATRFVADFMGAGNVIEAVVGRGGPGASVLHWNGIELHGEGAPAAEGARVGVALRPEMIHLSAAIDAKAAPNCAAGRLVSSVDHGAFATVVVALDGEGRLTVRRPKAEQARSAPLLPGAPVQVSWSPSDVVVLREAATGAAPFLPPTLPEPPR